MANRTTLKTKKDGTILYPETVADIVYTLDSDATGKKLTVEQKLQNIENKLSEVEQAKDYKGYFPNVDALLAKYPNGDHPERAGWYARVGESGTSDTTMYYWDLEDDAWVKGAIVSVTGASTVNGIEPDSEGNITLTAENIPTAFTTEQGVNKSTQEVFNDLQLEHNQLEDEIEVLQNKTSVLYLTNSQFEDAINRLVEPYANGQVAVANDDGDYKIGSSYKFVIEGTEDNPVFRWEEITSSGGTEITDTLQLSKEVVIPELDGTMTYENLTSYLFNQDSDGYFVAESTPSGNSVYIIKLNFNLNRETDLVFNYDTKISNSNYYFAYFSRIDEETPISSDYNGYQAYKTTKYSENGDVIYKNVPAGNHFITVGYKRYSSASDTFKFKLVTDLKEEEKVETVENNINVKEDGNLYIKDDEILTKNNATRINLVGTEENPIRLRDLDVGEYSLSGAYLVLESWNVNYYFWDTPNYADRYLTSQPFYASVIINNNKKYIIFHNATNAFVTVYDNIYSNAFQPSSQPFNNNNGSNSTNNEKFGISKDETRCLIISYNINPTEYTYYAGLEIISPKNFASMYRGSNSDYTVLGTNNTAKYEPTGNYNPSTKLYVDSSLENYKPILELDNPTIETQEKFLDKFSTNVEETDNSLYFYKKDGLEISTSNVNPYTKTNGDLVLLKTLPVEDYGTVNIYTRLYFKIPTSLEEIGYGAYLSHNSGEGKKLSFNSVEICSTDGVWADDGTNSDEYFNISQFVKINSKAVFNYDSIDEMLAFELQAYTWKEYFKTLSLSTKVKATRIALYEDLSNAGGSGSKPITKFDNPSSSELDLKYEDTFGTSKDLNNKELYYYKQVDVANFFSPLHFQDAAYYDVFIEKSVSNERVYDAEDKDVSVTLCSLRLSDAESNSVGNISLVLTTNSDGMISSISIPEVGEDIYTINNGWVTGTDEKYFRLKEYLVTKQQFSNVKTFDTEENMNSDEHFAIYLLYETYFYGTISENVEELLPIRLALYSDVAGIQQSADYKGDYQSGTWYNRGDIVSGAGEGIFYVCLVENNGIVQPEYFNEYTEFEGVRYWQNMNYNTYISLNAMSAQSDGVGRNIADTYATKEELENAVISGGGTPLPSEMVKYYEEYDPSKTYSKNDMIYYANHFFISVSENNTGNTPNINMFYTMIGNNLYWRNMGYSATYADNATNDGDGNNISNTYVHNTTTINNKPLTSNVILTASDVSTTFGNGDSVQTVLKDFETGLLDVAQATVNGTPLIDNPVLTASDVGAVATTSVTSTITATTNVPTSNAVKEFVENKGYATQSTVASLQQSLGTQCTFVLSGTTLTITPK